MKIILIKRNSKGQSLQEILEKIKRKQKETIENLHSITEIALPNVVETVK
jgi:hypothetical protein